VVVKPDYRKSRKRKVVLLYTAGVLIPGIILGYMAFRGIQNDQAIREKESRNRLEQVKTTFFASLDSLLYADFQKTFTAPNDSSNILADPFLKTALIIAPGVTTRLIAQDLLYLPPEFLENPDRMVAQENMEPDRLALLIGEALELRTLNRVNEACKIYEKIAVEFPEAFTNHGIPAQTMAWLELAKLKVGTGGAAQRSDYCQKILNSLLNPKLKVGADYFNFMYHSVMGLAAGDDTVCQNLIKTLDKESAATARLGSLLTNPEPVLSDRNLHIIPIGTGVYLRQIYLDDIIALSADNRDAATPTTSLLVMDLKSRFQSVLPGIISSADPDGHLKWRVTNAMDSLIYSSSPKIYSYQNYAFPDGYPRWTLSLFESQAGFFAALIAPGRGVFLLIFIFITAMMLFGLFFTLYTLNQEIRLNALKSDFISNVSHELKSPLTSIRLRAEMLTENRVPSVQKPEYYSNILDQSEHLSHLIENILDFSRIEDERKKYRFEETNLVPFIRKIVDSMNQRQIGSNIRIEFSEYPDVTKIRIDQDSIEQVMYNLLDNACKFSGESKKVHVSLENLTDEIRITVRDWGLGMSKKDQERIFERFYRATQARDLGIKGSGIGLTLVKRIVEAHNGRIIIQSEPGQGTEVQVYLPIRQSTDNEEDIDN
jgi:signal transduction histidine kinase